ncbi:hypothetical protein QBC43DRAFT_355054 [Cladorrhinum sp. PSN259]|nr:hypothetical protein QBC43DRAFT_355054 [Cladorrhinum sp. PSN259]
MEDLSPYLTTKYRGFPLTYQTKRFTQHSFLCERCGLTPGTLGRHDPPIRKSALTIRKSPFSDTAFQWEHYARPAPRVTINPYNAPIKVPVDAVIAGLEPRFHHNFRVLQTETQTLQQKVDHLSNVIREMSSRLGPQRVSNENPNTQTADTGNLNSRAQDNSILSEYQSAFLLTAQELAFLKQQRAEEKLRLEQLELDLDLTKRRASSATLELETMKEALSDSKSANIFNGLPTGAATNLFTVADDTIDTQSKPKQVSEGYNSESTVRSSFLAFRQTLLDFSTSSSLQLGPLTRGSKGLCPPEIWNSSKPQQRSHRVMAKIFEILWKDVLRPDLLSFGLDGVMLSHDDRTVSQPEKHFRTLEKKLLELGVSDSALVPWRRSIISTTTPLRNLDLSLEPTTSKIFSALSPVIQFVFARNAEQVRKQILGICKDAMKLKLVLRTEEGGWKIEMPDGNGIGGSGKRLVLFGKLTRQSDNKTRGGRVVVESGWRTVASPREGRGKVRIEAHTQPRLPAKNLPGVVRERDKASRTPSSPEAAQMRVKSLPEIARERKEAQAKTKALEEERRKRLQKAPPPPPLSPPSPPSPSPPIQPSEASAKHPATPPEALLFPTPELWATLEAQKKSFAEILLDLAHSAEPLPPSPYMYTRQESPPLRAEKPVNSNFDLNIQQDILSSFEAASPRVMPRDKLQPDGGSLQYIRPTIETPDQQLEPAQAPAKSQHTLGQPQYKSSTSSTNLTFPSARQNQHPKKPKRKRKRGVDDPWGVKPWTPSKNTHEKDPEDSNESNEVPAGVTTRSSTPGSGVMSASETATMDAEQKLVAETGSDSATFGRGSASEKSGTVDVLYDSEGWNTESMTGTLDVGVRKRRRKGKEKEDSMPSVLAKVMRLFEEE